MPPTISVSEANPTEQGLKPEDRWRTPRATLGVGLRGESNRTRIETSPSADLQSALASVSEANPTEQGLKQYGAVADAPGELASQRRIQQNKD